MKKFIAMALVLVMMAVLGIPAVAATTGTTEVTYTVGESYVLTVPATLTVDGADGDLTVSDYNVLAANQVKVSVSAPTWKLGDKAYKLNEVTADGVIATFTENGTVKVAATFVDGAPTAAGTYNENVTCTGAIVAK